MSQPWDISITSPDGGPVRIAGKATGEPSGGSLPEEWTTTDGVLTTLPTDPDADVLLGVQAPEGFFNTSGQGTLFQVLAEDGTEVLKIDTWSDFTIVASDGNMPPNLEMTSVEAPGAFLRVRGYRPPTVGQPQPMLFAHGPEGETIFKLSADGTVIFGLLPTENPAIPGSLWNDEGTVKVSAG